MIRINLASAQNEKIRCCLESPAYSIHDFGNHEVPRITAECHDNPGSFTLLQIDPQKSTPAELCPAAIESLAAVTHLVCITVNPGERLSSMLLSAGVCDCLCTVDPHYTAAYIAALSTRQASGNGTFAVLDRNSSHVRIISGIVSRFGYNVMQAETIEAFYAYISANTPVMTLINLGTEVDFNRFIRESHSSTLKKSPVIAYKDLSEGLFVHEVLNGLGRITRLILSPEELYRMLIDMLIKKNIISGTSALNHSVEYERYGHYRNMTLQQMYYEIHADPCAQQSLITLDRTETMINELEVIRRCLILVGGISWLACPAGTRPTCGAGA
ncbi:MAG: hypothetical protein GXY14_05010 [Spirochaetes bacterium]|nr:hypothetical protein [Spirochaetota bacterium]